jgi:hypothetical protein
MSRLGLFAVLYVTQYLGIGFITVGLVVAGVLAGLEHQRRHGRAAPPATPRVPAAV